MANIQKISCKNMKTDAQLLEEAIAKLPDEVKGIQHALMRLNACWEGPAWSQYQQQVMQDLDKLSSVYKILAELQKGLGTARDAYIQAEYDVYTDFKNMWI